MKMSEREKKIELLKNYKDKIKYCRSERNECIVKNTLKGVAMAAPVAVIATIIGSHFVINKDVPGRIDYVEQHARYTIHYSSLEGTSITTEYVDNSYTSDDVDSMCYYGPWVEQENGTYKCVVKEYELNDITENQIYEVLRKDNLSFEDTLSLSVKSIKEKEYFKDNITPEELEKGSYFEITVYDENKQDTTLAKETEDDNMQDIGKIIIGILFAGLSESLLLGFTGGDLLFFDSVKEYNDCIKKYKNDCKKLKKELGKLKK